MAEDFDPYYKWLGIPPSEQPANHYRLLGVVLFEDDTEVIDSAANRQMAYLQDVGVGPHERESQELLNEIAAARRCLLNANRKTRYDDKLKAEIAEREAAASPPPSDAVPSPSPDAAAPPSDSPTASAESAPPPLPTPSTQPTTPPIPRTSDPNAAATDTETQPETEASHDAEVQAVENDDTVAAEPTDSDSAGDRPSRRSSRSGRGASRGKGSKKRKGTAQVASGADESKKPLPMIIGGVVGVIAIVAVAVFLSVGGDDEPQTPSTPPSISAPPGTAAVQPPSVAQQPTTPVVAPAQPPTTTAPTANTPATSTATAVPAQPAQPAQQTPVEPLKAGLAAHWKFDEIKDNVTANATGDKFKGTVLSVTSGEGKLGKSGVLAGRSQVSIADPRELYLGDADYSISAWVKTSKGGVVFAKTTYQGQWVPNAKCLYVHTTGQVAFRTNGQNLASTRKVNDNAWHHIALVHEKSGRTQLFIDAAPDNLSNMRTAEIVGYQVGVRLGAATPDFPMFQGELDDVRVYGNAIEPKTIAQLADKPVTVTIAADNSSIVYGSDHYQATVAVQGGWLTQIAVGDQTLLAPGVGISKGSHFVSNNQTPPMGVTEWHADNLLVENTAVKIAYKFGVNSMTWSLTNKIETPVAFQVVMAPSTKGVLNLEDNKTVKLKSDGFDETWKRAVALADSTRLEVRGHDTVKGPGDGQTVVWTVNLKAKETRDLTLKPGKNVKAETDKLAALQRSKANAAKAAEADAKRPVGIAAIFTDNMVLQREKPIPLSGSGPKNSTITVKFNGQSHQTKTNAKNAWALTLPASKASATPQKLTATNGKTTATLKNVLVGDVWLAAGDVNMRHGLKQATNQAKQGIDQAVQASIRFFQVRPFVKNSPQATTHGVKWQVATKQTLVAGNHGASTAAILFAAQLKRSVQVPIGIIQASFDDSCIPAWFSSADVAPQSALGKHLTALSRNNKIPEQHRGYSVFNGMLNQWKKFPIRGVLWWQGQHDIPAAHAYSNQLVELIANLRKTWGGSAEDFPFIAVQLTPSNKYFASAPANQKRPHALSELCFAQIKALSNVDNATVIPMGDIKNVNTPLGGRTVAAKRAADWAAVHVYAKGDGKTVAVPEFDSAPPSVGRIIKVKFKNVGDGLKHVQGSDPLPSLFEVAGDDEVYHAADTANISAPDTVSVGSKKVARPLAVRYAWKQDQVVNLVGGSGLPVTPFQSVDAVFSTEPPRPAVDLKVLAKMEEVAPIANIVFRVEAGGRHRSDQIVDWTSARSDLLVRDPKQKKNVALRYSLGGFQIIRLGKPAKGHWITKKDATSKIAIGNCPKDFVGFLGLRVHDIGAKKRTATIRFEGDTYKVPVTNDQGGWLKIPITQRKASDGQLVLRIVPKQGSDWIVGSMLVATR